MKKAITIRIPEPCNENWDKMTPSEKGKHCAVCEKEVIDFTAHTKEQLYKQVTSGSNMCGRFRQDQLNTRISLHRNPGRSFAQYAASLLVPAALFSTRDISAQTDDTFVSLGKPVLVEMPVKAYDSLGIGSLSRKLDKKSPTLLTITGIVTENNGPLPGAIITVKGTVRQVQSDFDGKYTIEVAAGETLAYSFIGFENREINIGSQIAINVLLEPRKEDHLDMHIIAGMITTQDYTDYKKALRKEKRAQNRQKKKNSKQ